MTSRLRIGYLSNEFPGIAQTYLWRETKALEEMGVEVDLVSTRTPAAEILPGNWTADAHARTTYLFPPSQSLVGIAGEVLRAGPAGWRRCLHSIRDAESLSLKERARLVPLVLVGAELAYIARVRGWTHLQVHSCADAANVALFASLLSGLPYSLTLHGNVSNYGPNQKEKWKHARFGIVITRQLLDEIRETLGDEAPERISIAPMGVDPGRFERTKPYRPWTGDGPFRIFSCGRVNRQKRQADLIAAVATLRSHGISAELDIAGSEDPVGSGHFGELEELIDELGLRDVVRLLGAVSEEAIRASLEEAHVFALVSVAEALGVATMEAMAMQVPVVVARTGGVTELVQNQRQGLVVEPERPEHVADALEALARDPDLSLRLGQAGRTRIVEHFHPGRSAGVLLRSIREAAGLVAESDQPR